VHGEGSQKTPRVDQAKSGVLNSDGCLHPFVEYRYREKDGSAGMVRFVAEKSKDTILFEALLNGLFTPGTPGPPGLGTREIAKQWKLQCGVTAIDLFE
jgi:hypothetical protein